MIAPPRGPRTPPTRRYGSMDALCARRTDAEAARGAAGTRARLLAAGAWAVRGDAAVLPPASPAAAAGARRFPWTRCGSTTSRASSPCFAAGSARCGSAARSSATRTTRTRTPRPDPGTPCSSPARNPSHSGIVANDWWDGLEPDAGSNVVDDPVQAPVGGTGRGASPANLHRLHGGRRPQEGVARLEGRRRLGQGPLGGPHGRPPRRRRLLVRIGARRVHHQHVLHEQRAALARGLEPRALPRPLRRPVLDAAPARRGRLPPVRGRGRACQASGTTRTRPSRTPSAGSRRRRASTTTSAARRSRTR